MLYDDMVASNIVIQCYLYLVDMLYEHGCTIIIGQSRYLQ